MAQSLVVELVDDLHGTRTDDVATVHFGLDGVGYEIDLTKHGRNALRRALQEYVAAARRVRRPRRDASARSREDARAIRRWARHRGLPLADRGRIPNAVIRAFHDATTGENGDVREPRDQEHEEKTPVSTFNL
ncbi:histone-like nucleoid-structuring protein Lsr2 [Umezawaea beigongshangensis]|uniref:histone-like nucleoid-structuring protein Lsr2 n=1 Tax=Umezawaea beigongshangensis TaxID=2780383 RepID=UPI0018F228CC|nr:Lsr2 family protein [Umezawaea beigongshangensis]